MSYDQIAGYSGFLPIYDEAVAEAQDGAVFVEVGVALGHSLAYLARKVIDSGKRIDIYAVDPWGGYARNGEQQEKLGGEPGPGDFRLFLDQMIEHAPEELERIKILRATSAEARYFFLHYKPVDMVMIDAAHDFESVRFDIVAWMDVVKVGGILAGDDHEPNYPGVQLACEGVFGAGNYEVRGTSWYKRAEGPKR